MQRFRIAISIALLGTVSSARALDIVFTDVGATPMTAVQLGAFNEAAEIWERVLVDPVTVNVNIAFEPPTAFSRPFTLGSATSAKTTTFYASYLLALALDSASAAETAALGMLPGILPVTDINGARNESRVTLHTANAKALGMGTGLDPEWGAALANNADAELRFNTNVFFDYDRSDGVMAGFQDFVTVAAHEIGHALGFASMADAQDDNPSFTLHPTPLDVWRLNETGGSHDLFSENRPITAGPAEYFDSELNNVSFSRGLAITTDPNCSSARGACQASHWRDNLPNLMKASLASGISIDPTEHDFHALDYIGWDRAPRLDLRRIMPDRVLVGWYPLASEELPDFEGVFGEFVAPPAESSIPQADFQPNAAIRLGIDLGIEGQTARSGLGLARFEQAQQNPNPIVVAPIDHDDPDHTVEEERQPMTVIPPRITDFMFISDDQGKQFVFRDVFGDGGSMWDPTLGPFGGYRIAGFVDGSGDGIAGDADGMMTFHLLASDPSGIPNPAKLSVFTLSTEGDNAFAVADAEAFGIPLLLAGDYNQNGSVDAGDYTVWRDRLGASFALSGENPDATTPGVVDQEDYDFWVENFGNSLGSGTGQPAVPEPASWALAVLSGLLLRRRRLN